MCEYLRVGVQLERLHRFDEAIAAYQNGYDTMLQAVIAENDLGTRKVIMGVITKFENRINEIKQYLEFMRRRGFETPNLLKINPFECPGRGKWIRKWEQLCADQYLKRILREDIFFPAKDPKSFKRKARKWKSLLLHGPSGMGKTYILDTIADYVHTYENCSVYKLPCRELVTLAGNGEFRMRNAFREGALRRDRVLSTIILLDDIDLLNNEEAEGTTVWLHKSKKWCIDPDTASRVKAEMLMGMRNLAHQHDGLIVIGTTAKPWNLDSVLRRRFDTRLLLDLPEESERRSLIAKKLEQTDTSIGDLYVAKTADQSPAIIAGVYENAKRRAHFRFQQSKLFTVCSETDHRWRPLDQKELDNHEICETARRGTIAEFGGHELVLPSVTFDDISLELDTLPETTWLLRERNKHIKAFSQ